MCCGGGGGSAAVEADNTLFSASKAKIIDLVSEGEIQGLVNGNKSIYIDKVPLQAADESFNFEGVSVEYRTGVLDQSYIKGFEGSASEVTTSFGDLDANTMYNKSITSASNLDAVRITISVDSLSKQEMDSGDLNGYKIEFEIHISNSSIPTSSSSTKVGGTKSFSGKTNKKYERSYRIDVPENIKGSPTIYVGVKRTTAVAGTANISDSLYWRSYTRIIDNKFRYPHSAIVAMKLDSKQFDNVPTRGFEVKGIKVKVPSNYTPYDQGHCSIPEYRRRGTCIDAGGTWEGTVPGSNLYSGYWDGTFKSQKQWTCNPAWILYDICTNTRYGLGRWLETHNIDKWSLYEVAKYCDAVDSSGDFIGVEDGWGEGGKEARFTCNMYIQGSIEAYKLVNDIASTFRGMLYWQQGQITSVQDVQKDPVMLFNKANVIDGQFNYEGVSKKKRHNVAHVTWNNPEDFYNKNVEYVEDAEAIASFNNQLVVKSINAVGCTSKGQARRVGQWLLYTEKYETEIVSFNTGLEGLSIRPGDIIKVADSTKSGVRYGGRVSNNYDNTTTSVGIDSYIDLVVNHTYNLSLINTEEACINSSGIKVINTPKCIDTNGNNITEPYGDYSTCTAAGGTWLSDPKELCLTTSDNDWKPYIWVETKPLSTLSNSLSTNIIELDQSFSSNPSGEYSWILEDTTSNSEVVAQTFRVLSIRESAKNVVEISALKHHSAKYNYIERGTSFSTKNVSILPSPSSLVPAPVNIDIAEELYLTSNNSIRNRGFISWCPSGVSGSSCDVGVIYSYTQSYFVKYRKDQGNWVNLGETSSTGIVIEDAPAGDYEVMVKTISITGKQSSYTSFSTSLLGKTAPPTNVISNNIEIQVIP